MCSCAVCELHKITQGGEGLHKYNQRSSCYALCPSIRRQPAGENEKARGGRWEGAFLVLHKMSLVF